jgi:hypothetical protein
MSETDLLLNIAWLKRWQYDPTEMNRDFFDPTPEEQKVVLIDAATLREAEKLIELCEQCNPERADILPREPLVASVKGLKRCHSQSHMLREDLAAAEDDHDRGKPVSFAGHL